MPNATLQTARYLTERHGGSTREDLCAAISTTYYALFEALAKLSADLFVGGASPDRAESAWRHIYISHDHTRIAVKCASRHLEKFPPDIVHFAELFLQLQFRRHQSDYEYGYSPNSGEVITDIELAEVQITRLLAVEEKHQRAFCVLIMFEKHRHEERPKRIAPEALKGRDVGG